MRRHKSPQRLVKRAHIILLAAQALTNQTIAQKLAICEDTVSKWRCRWVSASAAIMSAEANVNIGQFEKLIGQALADMERSGSPADFTAYQICQILAVAQEKPMACGYPISHWTPNDLRTEVIKRQIVADISGRTIGRFLNDGDLQPHRIRYWEYPDITDIPQFKHETQIVCRTYEQAPELARQGGHTVSVDEKTSIQARGTPYPTLPMKACLPERQEFNYIRHGSVALIAGFDVASGQVIASIEPTRTEADFLTHIKKMSLRIPKPHGYSSLINSIPTNPKVWLNSSPNSAKLKQNWE